MVQQFTGSVRRRMAIVIFCLSACSPVQLLSDDSFQLFLVRHAEKVKAGDDPALSEQGLARARALARLLADSEIQSVWASDFRRTRETAAPAVESQGLELRLYDPHALETFAQELLAEGQSALVIGHSNTTPELVERLGGDPHGPIDDDSEFDRLYILTLVNGKAVATTLLRYSAK